MKPEARISSRTSYSPALATSAPQRLVASILAYLAMIVSEYECSGDKVLGRAPCSAVGRASWGLIHLRRSVARASKIGGAFLWWEIVEQGADAHCQQSSTDRSTGLPMSSLSLAKACSIGPSKSLGER